MPTPDEKLAESLDVLKALQEGGRRVFRSDDFTRVHRERLAENRFLQDVMKGWLISSSPGAREGDSTPWYASFWEFCARYCEERFGDKWYLSPEQSLWLHGERTVILDQVVVNSPKGTNNKIELLFGTSLYDLKVPAMPPAENLVMRDSLRLFSPAASLVGAGETFFASNPVESQAVLASLPDASDLLTLLLDGGNSTKAGYLAGAYRRIGRGDLADEIVRAMKRAGYDVRENDPFEATQVRSVRRKWPRHVRYDASCAKAGMMTAHVRNGQSGLEKSLPSLYYSAPEIFKQEQDLIFAQEWFCAGREEELPSLGSHIVVEVAGQNILVVRTMKGELRAHYNVCRHRGARLCPPLQNSPWKVNLTGGITSSNVIRCSYHQWTYNLEGELLGAPFLKDTEGFCREDFSLYPVGVDTWGGFFFLNLNPKAASDKKHTLRSRLGSAVERVARYPLAELQTGHSISYDVAANWKILMENYNECYHCGGVHPELCEIVPDFKQAGGSNLNWENGIPHRAGAYTFTKTGTTSRAPFPGLSEEEKVRHKGELSFPNLMISLACDHVAAFLLWPLTPARTQVDCRFLFHPVEVAKPAFNPMDAVEFWDLVNRQDWSICEQVQAGVSSRVHKFGYYGRMEDPSLDIRNYVRERLDPIQPSSDP